MRKRFSFLLATLLACSLYATEPVINRPAIEFNTTGLVSVTGMEVKKKEIRLHVHSLQRGGAPLSAFIEDCATGKRSKARECLPAPEGNTHILVFARPGKKTQKINYGAEGHTFVYGISLRQKEKEEVHKGIPPEVFDWIDEELAKAPRKAPASLLRSEANLCKEPARLIGYISGYDRRAGFTTATIYAEDSSSADSLPILVVIHEDGRFEGTVPCVQPSRKNITLRNVPLQFYIEPGQTLAITVEWEDFLKSDCYEDREYHFESIRFSGPLAQINQELQEISSHPERLNAGRLHPRTKALLQCHPN